MSAPTVAGAPPQLFTREDVCRAVGVSRFTLHRWELNGWTPKPRRDWRGWRLYTAQDVEEIRRVKQRPRPSQQAPVLPPLVAQSQYSRPVGEEPTHTPSVPPSLPLTPPDPATLTIGSAFEYFLRGRLSRHKSVKETERRCRRWWAPFWDRPLGSVTRWDVIAWHAAIGERNRHVANSALEWLAALYTQLEDWDLYVGRNPARRVKKFPTPSRDRFVQPHELPRLRDALAQEPFDVRVYFWTLLLTAARRDEARMTQWAHLDLTDPDAGLWRKPTTKNGRPHVVPLPPDLTADLLRLARAGRGPYVFSITGARPLTTTSIFRYWVRIRTRADLKDVRIHDLRRTAASIMAAAGENLTTIQHMLNHTQLSVTNVYARLNVDALRLALNRNAARMETLGATGNGHGAQAHAEGRTR